MSILNIASYKFANLTDLPARRKRLRKFCHHAQLRGTILLSTEGINLFVAGDRPSIASLVELLEADDEIGPLVVKESFTDYQPFTRMLVKIKKEIIAFGVDGISPADYTSKRITPTKLKEWLDNDRPVLLLDTRNNYEVSLGTFDRATHLKIDHFREFPDAVKSLPTDTREQPVVTFCTGGIRCEKAAPLLEQIGFRDVYQLDGGILNYFAQVGGAHYRGDCFVFDQRVAVDAALRETNAAQCYACQAILTLEDQQSPHYVKSESCPYCFRTTEEAMQATIAKRHTTIRDSTTPLPGSTPYDNYRPLHVAGKWDGLRLMDFLQEAVPSVSRARWEEAIQSERILLEGLPVGGDRRVVAGEKYEHLIPNVVEPDVNVDIRILYEDSDVVVVEKPAPLPIHPAGRFNKNTLTAILAPVYAPERLRHAHRLDANTTGIVLFARHRRSAKHLQAQFMRGDVEKHYLVRVLGHPTDDEFECRASISREPTSAGARLLDPGGTASYTRFQVLERFDDQTALLVAYPITGRTNQIRVHLWSLGLPIVGDPTYGPNQIVSARQTIEPGEPAMALHAWKLSVRHPATNRPATFESPVPCWAELGTLA